MSLVALAPAVRGASPGRDPGTGLKGEYFSDPNLKDLKFTRVDPKVDFRWTNTPPDKAMAKTNFSVRWTGSVKPACSEVYTFYTFADDGVVLWVDDELLIDAWDRRWGAEDRATIQLEADRKYNIRLEYFQSHGEAAVRLLWSSESVTKEIIPQDCLYPLGKPPPERVRCAAAIPVFALPPDLPALSNTSDWPHALAALEAVGVPRCWLLLGPRPDANYKVFDHRRPYDSDISDDWTLVPRDEGGRPLAVTLWERPPEEDGADGFVDLAQILARDNQALAFARTDVDWPVAGPALLWLTPFSRCAVYLNNDLVFAPARGGGTGVPPVAPGPLCLPLCMKQGRNVLKLRTGQHAGPFGFSARLERNDPPYRIALLERLLGLFPDEAVGPRGMAARLEIARRYEQLDRPREALAAYQQALALFGENDEVLAAANEAVRRLPEKMPGTAAVGGTLSPAGAANRTAWETAEQEYRALLRQGHATSADGVLRGFLARNPFHEQAGAALLFRGALRQDFGLGDDSVQYFERVLRESVSTLPVRAAAGAGLTHARGLHAPRYAFETAHETQVAVEGARRQIAAGNPDDIEKGARSLGAALRTTEGALLRLADARSYTRHVGVREYVRAVLASLSPAALAIYHRAVAESSEARLTAAAASGDVLDLQSVADQYQSTPVAARALNQAGNLALDRGVYNEAASCFRRLLRECRGSSGCTAAGISEPAVLAKLARSLAQDGQLAAAQEVVARLARDCSREKLTVAGVSLSGDDYARTLASGMRSGGTAPGAASAAGMASPEIPVWVQPLPQSSSMETARGRCDSGTLVVLQTYPVLTDSRVYAGTLESLQALDLLSGEKLWARTWRSAGSPLPNQFTGFPVIRPALQDGRLYMRALSGRQSALRCYRADDGAPCWDSADNPAVRKLVWLSDPVIVHGAAIAVFLERGDEAMNTHGLAALDAATGELRWRRTLVTGETGLRIGEHRLAPSMQLGPPAASDGVAYAPTGLGSLAAVNTLSGEPVWLSGYPRVQISDPLRGNSGLTDDVYVRTRKLLARGAAAPVVADDVVVLAPADAPCLIGFDRHTGALRWRHDLLDSRFLAGPCDGNVLAVDDTVRAIRAATGRTVWECSLPSAAYGAPLCSNGVLYVPTQRGLQLVDVRNGTAGVLVPWDSRLGPVGNLVLHAHAEGTAAPQQDRLVGVNENVIAALGGAGSPKLQWPLADANALAAAGKLDAAAEEYRKAALTGPDSVLEALCGWVKTLQALNRAGDALAELDGLLAGKPALLQSSNGGWHVMKSVLADGLRARLGHPAPAPAAERTPLPQRGLSGALGFAWRLEMGSPQLLFPSTGPADSCWAYAGMTLYWLRFAGVAADRTAARPEVLWQTYVGLDDAWVVVGPAALAVGNARKLVFVDRATGEVLWSVTVAGLQNKAHAGANLDPFRAVAMDGTSAAVIARDALLCFDLRTGKERWWNKQYERRVLHHAFVDGTLAEVSGYGGQPTVYNAYDPKNGTVLASNTLNRTTDWTPGAASPDGRLMVFRSQYQALTCVDMATGHNAWEAKVPNLDFRWEHKNLSWEDGAFVYSGANRDRADRGRVVLELNPKDGSPLRAYAAPTAKLGDSVLYLGDAGWGRLGISRGDMEPVEDRELWQQKRVWSTVLAREHGEGSRFLKAFVSSTNDRVYLLFTRETASLYFVLRTLDWASGQLLDEEILPGTPFHYEGWDKPYRGVAATAGDLLLYTASDGLYAYTPRGATRHQSAASLRAALAGPALNAAARHDLRCSLAGMEPVVLHALLASPEIRVDGELGEWDQSVPLEVAGAECFTPLQVGAVWGGPDDLSARVYAAWNNSAVFIAVDVRDDQWVPPASVAALTGGDSIRLAVNAAPDPRYGYDPRGTVVCALALVNGETVLNVESGPLDDPQLRPLGCVTRAPDGHGLRYELALPWPLLRHDPAFRPGERRELRVGLSVYDNDGNGAKGALEWGSGLAPAGGDAWQAAPCSVFPPWLGQLSLLDISRERIQRYKKAIAYIPDTPEAMQYLRMILASARGPQAPQERAAELVEFVKAHPDSVSALRTLIFLRSAYNEMGAADAAARALAVAKAAKCPAAIIDALVGTAGGDETGAGLEGEYYSNRDFTDLKVTRVDAAVNFDWNGKSPHPSLGAESYSVRWTGQVKPAYSEVYTFYTWSDDGVRLWVDNKLLVDNWTDHSATENSGTVTLGAGIKYDIKIEYFQGWGAAVIALGWSSPSQRKEIVPQNCLYPPDFLGTTAKRTPGDRQKLQDGYRAAARLLPDSPDGWVLLQRSLEGYAAANTAQRSRECELYLSEFPDTCNALRMLLALKQLYAQAGRNAIRDVEEQMQACKLPREARRAFYTHCIPAWTAWHVLGPVQAEGENRGMEQVMAPERAVDLAWKGAAPLEIPLAWTKIARAKHDPDTGGCVDFFRCLVEKLDPQKKAEIESAPYFAYAYRKVTVPAARRALFFFGVNDTLAVWLNGKRVVAPCAPGAGKDSRAVEVLLREGDNEILLKAGAPNSRLQFFFRIADPNGRPFDDLPME